LPKRLKVLPKKSIAIFLILQITQAYDIWSFGISIIELLSNTEVFKGYLNNEEKRQQIYDEYLQGEMQLKTPQEIVYRLLLQRKHEIPPREEMDEELEKFMQKMVLTTLARNVIAQGQGPKYPGIQEIANDLDMHFRDPMKIVRVRYKQTIGFYVPKKWILFPKINRKLITKFL
jgi:serine/threonine protein kinase